MAETRIRASGTVSAAVSGLSGTVSAAVSGLSALDLAFYVKDTSRLC